MRALLVVVALLALGCGCASLGDAIDDTCLAGKLSQEQADAINARPWSGRNDDFPREVQRGDRVLAHECSNFWRQLQGLPPKR